MVTHRPHRSSVLGLPYRILFMNPKKELLWGLWLVCRVWVWSVEIGALGLLGPHGVSM